ncbi:hypothetical protein ABZZ17_33360 [Streptomyces sp. NPDC006512]|uniref:hypothetical protein n=1 Tax=Streptomyces sp. NPDC006512 TaxID=3154307 RepID=UPI0033A93786
MNLNRRTRLILLAPVMAGSLALGSAALAGAAAPAAVPAATCSTSGVLADGTVNISGGGFQPGPAFLQSSTGDGAGFSMNPDGTFNIAKAKDGQYSVQQGSTVTKCSGGSVAAVQAGGTTLKAGIVAGWDAVKGNCDAKAPPQSNQQFSQGWNKGAAVAKEAFC